MSRPRWSLLASLVPLLASGAISQEQTTPVAAPREVDWPSFRGPAARGWVEGFATPERWDVERGEGVLWKCAVPGLAHSSPVIHGERLYVTTAVRAEGAAELKAGLYGSGDPVPAEGAHSFRLYCLDKRSGELLWMKVAHEGPPRVKRHPKSSHANSTPATDGERVVAFFGSEGLFCYDAQGELKWRVDLGVLDSGAPGKADLQWGFASSPVICGEIVVVQCDIQEHSFLAALSLKDGKELWRTPRDEGPTWGTPTVDVRAGRAQVIANGYRHIGGYDLRSGKELWKLRGGGDVPVPTPLVAHDLIFITSAHGRQAPIYAVEVGAGGEVRDDADDEHMRWCVTRRGNYIPTPIVYGEHLFLGNDTGILSCYRAADGELLFRERLGGGRTAFSASAVAADGKLYLSSEPGEVFVVKAGPEFELLAVNPLGEVCMATPAISEGVLYFRTRGHLVAIGAP